MNGEADQLSQDVADELKDVRKRGLVRLDNSDKITSIPLLERAASNISVSDSSLPRNLAIRRLLQREIGLLTVQDFHGWLEILFGLPDEHAGKHPTELRKLAATMVNIGKVAFARRNPPGLELQGINALAAQIVVDCLPGDKADLDQTASPNRSAADNTAAQDLIAWLSDGAPDKRVTPSPAELTRLNNQAYALDAQEAIRLYKLVVLGDRQVWGEEHRNTLVSWSNLARCVGRAGDYALAIRLYEWLIPRCEQAIGTDHVDTFKCRDGLAVQYGHSGDFGRAVELYEALVGTSRDALGWDHDCTLRYRLQLATYVRRSGNVIDAIAQLRAIIADIDQASGVGSARGFASRHTLGNTLGRSGAYHEAAQVFNELAQSQEQAYGADHPDTLSSQYWEAFWLVDACDFERAAALLRSLIDRYELVFGKEHQKTFKMRYELAYCVGESGDTATAIEILGVLLIDQERVLGSGHRDTVKSRISMKRYAGGGTFESDAGCQ